MHAMRMVRIHGSMHGSQSAANRLELNGQKSQTPLDWQASIAMCSKAAQNDAASAPAQNFREACWDSRLRFCGTKWYRAIGTEGMAAKMQNTPKIECA